MIHLFVHFFRRYDVLSKSRGAAALLLIFSIIAYASTGYMYFELPAKPDLNWGDAIWWAFVTMTTVGYGDYFPESMGGRLLVGIPTMLLGVSMLGYLLSLLASYIMEVKLKEVRGMTQIHDRDHIIICRYNDLDSTRKLLSELRDDSLTADKKVVLLDDDLEELPEELAKMGLKFVRGRPEREQSLNQANLLGAAYVFIRADASSPDDSDHRNLAVALTIERLFPNIFTVVECIKPENIAFFEHANCDSVICLASLTSQMMVQEMQDPGVHSIVSELTSNSTGQQFYVVKPPNNMPEYKQLFNSYAESGKVLIGLRRGDKNMLAPALETTIEPGDLAILIADQRPVA